MLNLTDMGGRGGRPVAEASLASSGRRRSSTVSFTATARHCLVGRVAMWGDDELWGGGARCGATGDRAAGSTQRYRSRFLFFLRVGAAATAAALLSSQGLSAWGSAVKSGRIST